MIFAVISNIRMYWSRFSLNKLSNHIIYQILVLNKANTSTIFQRIHVSKFLNPIENSLKSFQKKKSKFRSDLKLKLNGCAICLVFKYLF